MTLLRCCTKIKMESVIIFLLLFPHLRPESLAYIAPTINALYNVGRIVSFIILLMISIAKRKKISNITGIVTLMQLWIVVTTYMNGGEIQRAMVNMISVISLMLLVDIFANSSIIEPFFCNFEWILYVNLLTVIMYPQGLYQKGIHSEFTDYFLGFKNAFFPFCIVGILLSGLLYLQERKSRLRPLLLMIVSFLNVFLVWSTTSFIAIAVTLIMFLVLVVIRKPKFLSNLRFYTLFIIYLAIDIMICVCNIIETVPFISDFVINVLHKQPTLTGRTVIWGLAREYIQKQPFIGYGIGEHITWAGYDWYGHNQLFEMLLEGGVPCLFVFFIAIIILLRKIEKCNDRLVYNVLLSVFSGLFVYYLAEAGTGTVFYLIFALSYHINEITNSKSYQGLLLRCGRKIE